MIEAMRAIACSLAAAAFFALGTSAYAQPETAPAGDKPADKPAADAEDENVSDADKARATKLFEEGRALMAEGKYDLACAKLDESHKLRPGIGALFNLADCNEKRGKLATAYKQFSEVAERTKAALQEEREKVARERVEKLETRIARVRVIVPSTNKVKLVKIDGQKIKQDEYNKPLPIELGEHVVLAETTTDEGEPFEETIEIEQPGKTVTVTIPVSPGAKMKRRVPMIIGGGVTAGIGVLLLGGAIAVGVSDSGYDGAGLAVGLGVLSVVHMAVGFPSFGVGFKKKPVYDNSADWVPVYEPSPFPQIGLGAGSASATWHF